MGSSFAAVTDFFTSHGYYPSSPTGAGERYAWQISADKPACVNRFLKLLDQGQTGRNPQVSAYVAASIFAKKAPPQNGGAVLEGRETIRPTCDELRRRARAGRFPTRSYSLVPG